MSLAGKRLEREEYWYRELKTIYPFGLNDNVRKVGHNNFYKQGYSGMDII